MHHRRGLMLVLSSPSGAGKTTLSRLLLEQESELALSISVTTRERRPGETEGIHYYFTSQPYFETMVHNDALLEYATVFGASYGTPRKKVEEQLAQGRDVLFDIDWQGRRQLAKHAPDDVVSIFILPPSMEELERRLRGRGQDSEATINARMAKATAEISHWHEYDYVIVNDDITRSLEHIRAILQVERLKTVRQTTLTTLAESMLATSIR